MSVHTMAVTKVPLYDATLRCCTVPLKIIHILLEDITTEPHAQDVSADVLRVWLSGYILQHEAKGRRFGTLENGKNWPLGAMRKFDRLMSAWPNQACSGVGVARELKR